MSRPAPCSLLTAPCALRILLLALLPALAAAQSVGQWELRKRGSIGFTSYGLTGEDGKAIGFASGVPAMISLGSAALLNSTTGTFTSADAGKVLVYDVGGNINASAGTFGNNIKNISLGGSNLQIPAAATDSLTDYTGDGWTFTEAGTAGTITLAYASTGGNPFTVTFPAETGTLVTTAHAFNPLILDAYNGWKANIYMGAGAAADINISIPAVSGSIVTTGISYGDPSWLTALSASKLTTGTLDMARIASASLAVGKISATGTPSSTTYLRGDGTWSTPTSSGITISTTTITGGTSGRLLTSGTTVGELALGTGVSTALGNATDAASGLLTYGIIGTSGTKLPLLNTANTFAAAQTLSTNGALSTPSLSITGTIITGGTATTTKPLVMLEVSGATSTGWSTSGTSLGINTASSFSGNYIDLQENGSRWFRVYDNGNTYGTLGLSTTGGQETRMHGRFGTLVIQASGANGSLWIDGDCTGTGGGLSAFSNNETTLYFNLQGDGVAGTIQMGSDASSPVSYILKPAAATGTNATGASFTLRGGMSTGTGAGGDVITQSGMTGSSGSTENTPQERVRIAAKYTDLTESTATSIASIACASGKITGGTAVVTVWANDGTDYQSITSTVRFDAVNKAGTVTAAITQTDNTAAVSTGTLTVTYTAVASGNNVLIKANATSSLTQTVLRARGIYQLNGDDVNTVTPQ